MGYFKFFILGIICVFVFMLSSCSSNQETLGDIANDMLSTKYVHNNEDNKHHKENSKLQNNNNKRGLLSWMHLNDKSNASKDGFTLPPKIIDNSIIEPEESPDLEVDNTTEVTKENSFKISFGFFRKLWNKANALICSNKIMALKKPYKENTISIRKGLNVVVLEIPYSEDLYTKTNKFNYSLSNNFDFDNKMMLKNGLEKQDVYKDYVQGLKQKNGLFNLDNPIDSIIPLHKNLINQLLSINNTTPNILYIFYYDYSNINDSSFISNQLYLSNYLSKIRSFAYGKKLQNIFIQEVKIVGLPVNQILLVLKPITKEQFSMLPKQTNLFNSVKVNSKDWLSKVNALEKQLKK